MSKNVAMFVDVANMYYAARGQDVDVDYVALLKHATKGRDLIRAYAYTGLDPENENQRKFIDFLGKNGYKPVVKDIRKFGDGRMKANLDIELVVDLFRLADRMDIAVIVSGDGDFAPAIRALQDKGVRCEVVSFKPNTSSDLIAVADEFMDIMKVASISRKEGRAAREVMSAPEMPAKEVSPEFGFREASPSVAAAALAALKTGSGNGRRTRGGTARRAAAPAEEPAGERVPAATDAPTEPAADSEEQARRRRRRRGGRGRGRSRREADQTTGAPTESAAAGGDQEPAWQEVEDISQIGIGEEREYTFEEADASTLAELGLSPEDVAAPDAPAAETPKDESDAKPRRRGGRRSTTSRSRGTAESPASDAADQQSEADATDSPKPRARSARRRGAAATKAAEQTPDAGATGDGSEAGVPKRARRTSRSKSASSGDAEASGDGRSDASGTDSAGEPQGIWGRFRGARKPRGTA